jgi:hypothetical protein
MLNRDDTGQRPQGWPDSLGHLVDASLDTKVGIGLKDNPAHFLF